MKSWYKDSECWLYGLFILATLAYLAWAIPFGYHECKKVGHSTLYCVMF